MSILTLVMQVPDSKAAITVARGGSGIEATGLELVCNPFHEFAVEQGLRLRDEALPPRPCPNEER